MSHKIYRAPSSPIQIIGQKRCVILMNEEGFGLFLGFFFKESVSLTLPKTQPNSRTTFKKKKKSWATSFIKTQCGFDVFRLIQCRPTELEITRVCLHNSRKPPPPLKLSTFFSCSSYPEVHFECSLSLGFHAAPLFVIR